MKLVKTFLIKSIIKELNYDILYYNNIDSRNKTTMDNIAAGFNGNQNVIQLFHKIQKIHHYLIEILVKVLYNHH